MPPATEAGPDRVRQADPGARVRSRVWGAAYGKITDDTCSATTIQRRRDEWTRHEIFTELEQICLNSYDKMIGPQLEDLSVDECIVKAPEAARPPVDPQSSAGNRAPNALLSARRRIRDPARLRDRRSELLRLPTAGPRWRNWAGSGFNLPEKITVHLNADYDTGKTRTLLDTLDCDYVISKRGTPLQIGARWVVKRTDSCHTREFRELQICTERRTSVIDVFIASPWPT